ncbi:MAG: hypothetical protein KY467_09700 [Gemmatimonadetes bacterium]|nr:hypothetical protein [Gemmatimonadota bacterium]
MLYTGGDQTRRMGDPARGARDEQRRFARRIDCDPSPRQEARGASGRGGSIRERGAWEQSRRGGGR